ncbi:hypothetical protein [Candidatus Electronema sp. JM]|uniref:hypothetical protein n=1 Tax=Candidatus Electronema sp. JM TaxID=3401571 RepID=UPI003AA9D9BF
MLDLYYFSVKNKKKQGDSGKSSCLFFPRHFEKYMVILFIYKNCIELYRTNAKRKFKEGSAMRTKSIMLGFSLALSLSATSSYALSTCPSGTITKAGAGYFVAPSAPLPQAPTGRYYWIDYICNTTPLPNGWPTTPTPAGTAAGSIRFRFLPEVGGSGYANMDGMYATALTAIALADKPVELTIHTFTADVTNGPKAGTYVMSVSINK